MPTYAWGTPYASQVRVATRLLGFLAPPDPERGGSNRLHYITFYLHMYKHLDLCKPRARGEPTVSPDQTGHTGERDQKNAQSPHIRKHQREAPYHGNHAPLQCTDVPFTVDVSARLTVGAVGGIRNRAGAEQEREAASPLATS